MQYTTDSAIAVLGFGRTGRALLTYLLDAGCTHITVRDKKEVPDVDVYRARGVRFVCGADYLENLTEDVIFRSPGLRYDLPPIARAVSRGATLTSETALVLARTPATVIGVTGSDGKTTTTTLITELLRASGHRVFCGGNIGTSVLGDLAAMQADDFVVLELSSFQLQTMTVSPQIAVLTNLTPNHLDYHRDLAEYAAAKAHICAHAPCRRVVYNGADAAVTALADGAPPDAVRIPFGTDGAVSVRDGVIWAEGRAVLAVSDILLPGAHNLANYLAAIGATLPYVTPEAICHVARTFRGVPHRMETVAVANGVTYLNSSIDSTPSRTAATLAALADRRGHVVLLLGGYDKHIPYDAIAAPVADVAKAVVLTGDTAPRILSALLSAKEWRSRAVPIYYSAKFDAAVLRAASLAVAGDTVLLSPASASFDAFADFAARGARFAELALEISSRKDVP